MTVKKPVIAIVEDDLDVAEMLDVYFRGQNYEVMVANFGEDGVEICNSKNTDLVILDIRLPDIDGYEVSKRLRENRRTSNIPIIFLTEKRNRSDIHYGLELGADDYITKPFDIQELGLRVRNILQHSELAAVYNPVTGLPEGAIIDERLTDCLGNESWAIVFIRLENLGTFRDSYGFVATNEVLRAASMLVKNSVRKAGNTNDFIGHYRLSEFIVITIPEVKDKMVELIRSKLEQSLDLFYPLKDRVLSSKSENSLGISVISIHPDQGPFDDLDHLKNVMVHGLD